DSRQRIRSRSIGHGLAANASTRAVDAREHGRAGVAVGVRWSLEPGRAIAVEHADALLGAGRLAAARARRAGLAAVEVSARPTAAVERAAGAEDALAGQAFSGVKLVGEAQTHAACVEVGRAVRRADGLGGCRAGAAAVASPPIVTAAGRVEAVRLGT